MHISDFQDRLEYHVQQVVELHHPLDWKEDLITHALVQRLRSDFRSATISGARSSFDLEWEAYKLSGRREQTHGDIGLLVRYRLPSGEVLEGAGFLEAKVRARDSNKFHAVRHEQVTRLLARSPQTRLALYDYNPVTVLDGTNWSPDSFDVPWHRPLGRRGLSRTSSAPVLPLHLAATVGHYDDTLYRFAHSFSHQLCRRYFAMHDLDFRPEAIAAVKGLPSELGSPNIVLVVRIAGEGQQVPEDVISTNDFLRPLGDA